jgi:hypothetical protein
LWPNHHDELQVALAVLARWLPASFACGAAEALPKHMKCAAGKRTDFAWRMHLFDVQSQSAQAVTVATPWSRRAVAHPWLQIPPAISNRERVRSEAAPPVQFKGTFVGVFTARHPADQETRRG